MQKLLGNAETRNRKVQQSSPVKSTALSVAFIEFIHIIRVYYSRHKPKSIIVKISTVCYPAS